MTSIGVRAFKARLSEYLRRAGAGQRIVVTDRGRPVAALSPVAEPEDARRSFKLVSDGLAQWSGGKPEGCRDAPRPRGKSVAQTVLEDRR